MQVRAKNGEADSDWSDPSDAVSTNAEETPEPDAPTITSVAVTSTPAASDTYGWGETIEISVTFSEAVDATDGTDFELSVGGGSNDRSARLLRGSGSATLVFGYTVVSSDEDDDGIWIGDQDRTLVGDRRISPQTGTITSTASPSTEADLTHTELGTQSGHKVDGSLNAPSAPTITSVAVTSTPQLADDTYGPGETIEVSVTFSEAVNATSATDFVLSMDGQRRAPLVRGNGTATLVFGYTVASGDEDDDGIWIGDQDRTLVGDRRGTPQTGTITSVASPSTEADLTHAALGQQDGHKVSSNSPPVFTEGDSTTRTVARSSLPDSDSGPGANVGAPVLARDADDDELKYDLEGDDRSSFIIIEASGQILTLPPGAFGGPPDYSGQDSYQVRVKARDGEGGRDTIAVTINFTGSVDDPPEEDDPPQNRPPTVSVTASATVVSPGDQVTLTATASDPGRPAGGGRPAAEPAADGERTASARWCLRATRSLTATASDPDG